MFLKFKIALLLIIIANQGIAQDFADFLSTAVIAKIDIIEEGGAIQLDLEPIKESDFLAAQEAYKSKLNTLPDHMETIGDTVICHSKNNDYQFIKSDDYPYSYIGYYPLINCHLIWHCKDICAGFLLDNASDEIMVLPSDYDQGVMGMPFSPKGSMLMVYSSYDGPDYVNYYDYRAEIVFYKVEKEKGLKGLQYFGSYLTKDWSISDINWIDENTIVLKLYQDNRDEFQYFKSKIKPPTRE